MPESGTPHVRIQHRHRDGPVAFRISVEGPANSGVNRRVVAEVSAAYAAEHFAHVGQAQIHAFNEVNRIASHALNLLGATSH